MFEILFYDYLQSKNIRNPANFDKSFLKEKVRLTPCDKQVIADIDQKEFNGFTFFNSFYCDSSDEEDTFM